MATGSPADNLDAVDVVDRPLPLVDGESAAWAVSLVVHLLALASLTAVTLSLPRRDAPLDLALQPLELVEPETLRHEFVSSDNVDEEIGALADGGVDGALAAAPDFSEQSLVIHQAELLEVTADRIAVELDMETARGPEFSAELPTQGVSSVGATGAEGAIDRLTHEILASLERQPTMVVWLFDQSGSLKEERKKVVGRFKRI